MLNSREGVDNFEFEFISEFDGYNSSRDKTNIKESFFVRGSKNVYKKLSGTIANRWGLKRRGTADSTVAGVKSSYEWYNSLGSTFPIRVCNNKLQVESDILTSGTYVWYDLKETSTLASPAATYTRFVFDTWWDNTEKKDRLFMVRGDDDLLHWSGGMALISSVGTNTLTKTGTATWAEAGFATNTGAEKKLVIAGVEYTYTGGETSTTLTGVTPDPAIAAPAISANAVAIQSIIITATKPVTNNANDFIKVVNNQIYVGSYTSRVVYVSEDDDFTDYTEPTPHTPGDPFLIVCDSMPKGIGVRQGKAHIFAGTSDIYIVSFVQVTVGTTLTEQVNIDKKTMSGLSGAYAHEFIDSVGDTLVWLSQDQQVRTYGDYRNIFTPAYPSLSQAIFTELDEEDFTDGHLRSIGDYIYITSPNNGRTYLYLARQSVDANGNIITDRNWQAPFVWNVSRIAEIDGVVYGHSNAYPQIYQLWDTLQWHDDSPTDEPIGYDSVLRMAYRSHSRRQGIISFDKAYYEGYASQGTILYSYVLSDYQGSLNLQNSIILDETTTNPAKGKKYLSMGASAPSIGDAPIGDNPLGDGLTPESQDQESLPKFRVITDLQPTNCFEYQLVVYSQDTDSRWEILALGTNATIVQEQQAGQIRR